MRRALSLLLLALPLAAWAGGAVSADHGLASEAGAEVLRQGGNAVDAAVAAALAAGVVQPAGSGLGGGGFAVVVRPDGQVLSLDFREVAPAAAHRDLYLRPDGSVDGQASRTGGLAVAVPGQSRGLARLVREQGSGDLSLVAAPAIRLADQGFAVEPLLVEQLEASELSEVHSLYDPLQAGQISRNPAQARALRRWVRTRGEDLHTGRGARLVAREVQGAGGLITRADLHAYTPRARPPVQGSYRGYTVLSMGLPSSGGPLLVQMLAVLEGWDLSHLERHSPEYVHLLAEVMKHAFADRARELGDPDFVEVPLDELLAPQRISAIRAAIDPTRTFPPEHYGLGAPPPEDAGTLHISAVDDQGGACALTLTINTQFGSGVVVEGRGVVLNNEMDDFSAAPGVPNYFGLVGTQANAIAPGKRPLSSMSPTILLDPRGRPALVVGASGGGRIISSTLQAILDVVDHGMSAQEAVSAPRIHHQWLPDRLEVEPGLEELVPALQALGHEVVVVDSLSSVQLVVGQGDAAADPRKGGRPAVVPSNP